MREGSMCVLKKRYWMKVVTSVMAVRLSEKARFMRKKSSLQRMTDLNRIHFVMRQRYFLQMK